MGGAAGRGSASGRGKRHGRQHEQQPHQQRNGSLKDESGPISPLLRLSMKAAEEKEGTGGSDGKDEKSMAEPTTATTKLDEREEGEVEEEASTMKPATNMNGEKDKDGAPAAKRQKLDDFMAKDSSNNSIIDSSSLLNICQPAFTSISKEKDNTAINQQVANPITAAAATNNSNAASKVKVAEPEWLSRHPPHLRRLVRAAADRSTTLLLMPAGMARRKENTTTHSPKQNVIRWRIELQFHLRVLSPSSVSSRNMVDASSNDNSDNLPASVITIFLDGIPESNKLSEIISAQLDVNPEGKNREARSKLRTMATMPRPSLHIITKVLPCPASRPVYTEIGSKSSIADGLEGLTVVEYPVFEIVKESDLDKFPRKIEELSGAD